MAFIVEQFVGDHGIQLGAEDIIRPFSIGTNWSKIRLGVRWAANGYAKIPDGVLPGIGVCTGNNAMYSGVCTDALLLPYWNAGTATTYVGTPPNNYYTATILVSTLIQQRTGSTTVDGIGGTQVTNASISANPTLLRGSFFFDLTKGTVGAASVTVGTGYTNAAQAIVDMSRGTFLANMENESGLTGATFVGGVSTPLPTRFTKDWNSMFVHWIRAVPTLCVYDMAVVRFA